MVGFQVAQAVEFVRALHVHLRKMTTRLAWIERQDITRRNAMQLEAAALRRDIEEAQILVDRLHRRYLSTNTN